MDTLYWTKLNPTVKIVDTKKKFFNNYLYKAVVYAPGCRIILNKHDQDAHSLLAIRLQFLTETKSYNYGGSWFRSTSAENLRKEARPDQLQFYIDNKEKFKNLVKIRIEEPHISLYSNDENQLYNICQSSYGNRLVEIHRPFNDSSKEILERGEIVIHSDIDYQYKIMMKECVVRDSNIKQSLSNYLYNLGNEVKVPKSLYRNLQSPSVYFMGGYFYAAQEDIITFINLICPDLIARIYKLSKLEK